MSIKKYRVVVISDAKQDLRKAVDYLVNVKMSPQAARNVMNDFHETRKELSDVAEMLRLCENPKLAERGLHRINFRRHNYYMLYYIKGSTAYVTDIFHDLEDAENKIK